MKGLGELIQLIARSRKGQNEDRVKGLLDAVGSDLLEHGQLVIAGMTRTTGEGEPDNGGLFGEGSKQFIAAGDALRSAVPNASWDGSCAHAYADQNTRQQDRTEAMADADLEVLRVIGRESLQIKLRRGFLDDQYNFLGAVSEKTYPLQFMGRYGQAAKLTIEMGALQTALGESAYQLHQLQSEVNQNAAELQQAVGRYSGVVDGAELSGTVDFNPPPTSPAPPAGGPLRVIPVECSKVAPPTGGRVGGGTADFGPTSSGSGAPTGGAASSYGPSDQAPPTTSDMPPMPSAPANPALVGSLMTPLGGLLGGATQAAGQRAAAEKNAKDKADKLDRAADEGTKDDENEKAMEKDEAKAAPGAGREERAPLHIELDVDPDRLNAPVTVRLDSRPVLPAATMMTAPLTLTA